MTYKSWFDAHALKHKNIVDKLVLKNYTKEQIIDYFDFDNMVKKEKNFCPLYQENKKCHEMESLNCYLCACPNFRFDDNGIRNIEQMQQYSYCNIDSKDGKQGVYGDKIHQDCSQCKIPHHKHYIKRYFDLSWRAIMKRCNINSTKLHHSE